MLAFYLQPPCSIVDSTSTPSRFLEGTQVPVPTHYFAVLTSCRNSSQSVLSCGGELQSVSFLLPHRPDNSESCNVSRLITAQHVIM